MARKPLTTTELDKEIPESARPLQERSLPIGSLVPNPRNPRTHPEGQLQKLTASIRRFGQPRPVLARRANRMIIAGHGVKIACERAGLTQIRTVLWDVDQATADAFMLGDNRLGQLGSDDAERVRALLRELGLTDVEAIGYSAAEVDELLADTSEDIDVLEIQTGEVADRFWISVRGPLKDQAGALKRRQTMMADLPEIHGFGRGKRIPSDRSLSITARISGATGLQQRTRMTVELGFQPMEVRRLLLDHPAFVGGAAFFIGSEFEALGDRRFERLAGAETSPLHELLNHRVIAGTAILFHVQCNTGGDRLLVGLFEVLERHDPSARAALAAGQHPIDPGEVELVAWRDDRFDRDPLSLA